MQLLNVGCGGNRPGPPWKNIDQLRSTLAIGTPERAQLDKEENYTDFDISFGLPFPPDSFDGILCSHVVEHFDCHGAVRMLQGCHRVLKPGGLLVVSVPDADYFVRNRDRDTPENAVALFGEPIHDAWQKSFFDYALFHAAHKQVLTYQSLKCLLLKAGFEIIQSFHDYPMRPYMTSTDQPKGSPADEIEEVMNRRRFSLELCAVK